MKVLLTNPIKVMVADPALFGNIQPIQLMYVAAYLEKQGHEVKIFDTVIEKSVKKFIKILKKFNPDVVGIGAVSPTIYSAWDTAELVKKYSDAKVVMGGDHVTFLPGETLYCCPYVDYIVRGEGEYTTADLLRSIEGKKKIEKVKGVSYRKGNKIVHNPPRPWIKNLDKLPHPAWHLVDMYKYIQMVGRSGLFVSSRGCTQGCSFCVSSRKLGLKWRSRSAKSVANEMMELASKYPKLDNLVSIDDNFMMEMDRVEKICDILIKNKFSKPWICQGRADTIVEGRERLLNKMKKAGCFVIQIGVESPFKDRLKAISKGIVESQAIKAVKLARDAGLAVRATYLFGFEDETIEKMRSTFDFAKNVAKSEAVQFAILTAFPGTPYFEKVKHKLITHDWRYFTVSHQFLNYDFDVEKELSRLYLKYHLRPSFLSKAKKMNINQFNSIMSFINPLIKSILGKKGNFLFDFGSNKWLEIDEIYWQEYILKKNLIFEETWEHTKPRIENLPKDYTSVKEILPTAIEIEKRIVPYEQNWIRMG